MPEMMNVKVPVQTHETLIARAGTLGMKKGALADALLRFGLALSLEEIQKIVVNAQLKQPKDNTK